MIQGHTCRLYFSSACPVLVVMLTENRLRIRTKHKTRNLYDDPGHTLQERTSKNTQWSTSIPAEILWTCHIGLRYHQENVMPKDLDKQTEITNARRITVECRQRSFFNMIFSQKKLVYSQKEQPDRIMVILYSKQKDLKTVPWRICYTNG
jgi:hypothetical protein